MLNFRLRMVRLVDRPLPRDSEAQSVFDGPVLVALACSIDKNLAGDDRFGIAEQLPQLRNKSREVETSHRQIDRRHRAVQIEAGNLRLLLFRSGDRIDFGDMVEDLLSDDIACHALLLERRRDRNVLHDETRFGGELVDRGAARNDSEQHRRIDREMAQPFEYAGAVPDDRANPGDQSRLGCVFRIDLRVVLRLFGGFAHRSSLCDG